MRSAFLRSSPEEVREPRERGSPAEDRRFSPDEASEGSRGGSETPLSRSRPLGPLGTAGPICWNGDGRRPRLPIPPDPAESSCPGFDSSGADLRAGTPLGGPDEPSCKPAWYPFPLLSADQCQDLSHKCRFVDLEVSKS